MSDAGKPNHTEAVALVVVGLALIVAAVVSYDRQPGTHSTFYAPSVPGWFAVVLFVLIGIVGRLIHIRDRRRAAKRKRDASPKT
jgi:uncharacterized membrane protein YidH (DUF202 family)